MRVSDIMAVISYIQYLVVPDVLVVGWFVANVHSTVWGP